MTTFAIFATDAFWGTIEATDEAAAIEAAAAEWGTEGDTDGITATEASADEAAQIEAWWQDGADAAKAPACIA